MNLRYYVALFAAFIAFASSAQQGQQWLLLQTATHMSLLLPQE